METWCIGETHGYRKKGKGEEIGSVLQLTDIIIEIRLIRNSSKFFPAKNQLFSRLYSSFIFSKIFSF